MLQTFKTLKSWMKVINLENNHRGNK